MLRECRSNSLLNSEVGVKKGAKANALTQLIICNWKKLKVYFREAGNDSATMVALLWRGYKTTMLSESSFTRVTVCQAPIT